jgi:hypothetical protein
MRFLAYPRWRAIDECNGLCTSESSRVSTPPRPALHNFLRPVFLPRPAIVSSPLFSGKEDPAEQGGIALGHRLAHQLRIPIRKHLNLSGSSSPHHEMQDQRDHREYEQQVNQAAGHVKHSETANPRYQQHNEQDCPDAHRSSPLLQVRTRILKIFPAVRTNRILRPACRLEQSLKVRCPAIKLL